MNKKNHYIEEYKARMDLFMKVKATKYTTKENVLSLFIIIIILFFHLIFTMALHIIPEP